MNQKFKIATILLFVTGFVCANELTPRRELRHQAGQGNTARVKQLINAGVDVDHFGVTRTTATAAAVAREQFDAAQALLSLGRANPLAGGDDMSALNQARSLSVPRGWDKNDPYAKGKREYRKRKVKELQEKVEAAAIEQIQKEINDQQMEEPDTCSRCGGGLSQGNGFMTITPQKTHKGCLTQSAKKKRLLAPVAQFTFYEEVPEPKNLPVRKAKTTGQDKRREQQQTFQEQWETLQEIAALEKANHWVDQGRDVAPLFEKAETFFGKK